MGVIGQTGAVAERIDDLDQIAMLGVDIPRVSDPAALGRMRQPDAQQASTGVVLEPDQSSRAVTHPFQVSVPVVLELNLVSGTYADAHQVRAAAVETARNRRKFEDAAGLVLDLPAPLPTQA